MNRTYAGVALSSSIRSNTAAFSTLVPSQTLGSTGQTQAVESIARIRDQAASSRSDMCAAVCPAITCHTRSNEFVPGPRRGNRSDIELTKTLRGLHQVAGTLSDFSSSANFAGPHSSAAALPRQADIFFDCPSRRAARPSAWRSNSCSPAKLSCNPQPDSKSRRSTRIPCLSHLSPPPRRPENLTESTL